MERQLVIFELGEENFGVDIAAVEGIVKMQEITRVPKAPVFVEGVTNLRGTVLPVIDLRKRLELPDTEITNETRIIYINLEESKVGMIVDAVSEVLTIQEEVIEPTPSIVSSVDTEFITGIAKVDDRLVTLLDLNRILSVEEKTALTIID
ncbi:MAG: chemotaxis protein CheW [Anaerolineaceae bacterium]|nr:chemotaxis protein CheW [Anaerolineaceae bacterium]